MRVDRVFFDTVLEEASVGYANRRMNDDLGRIAVINVETTADVNARASAKSVKYSFSEPVKAVVEINEDNERILNVHDL